MADKIENPAGNRGVSANSLREWPHLKRMMRRFSTKHRLGTDSVETETDQNKRAKRTQAHGGMGYQSGVGTAAYKQNINDSKNRMEKYSDYREMSNDATISSALDIYADESSQTDPIDHNCLKVECDDDAVLEEVEKLLFQILRINDKSWDILRRLCAQGDCPFEVKFRKDFRGIYDIQRMDHMRFDRVEEDGKLVGFKIRSFETNSKNAYSGQMAQQKAQEITLSPFRVIHWKIPDNADSIYGRSTLEAARRTWRQVRLMEDSIVIYRISRGAERRVFYINVGNLAADETEGYIRNLISKFKKKPFVNPRTNEIDEKSNPLGWDEDFYVPLQSEKDNSRIEQLPGGQNMGDIEDLRFFRSKIDDELKVPTNYMNREGNFDSKAGLSQQDIRFSRTIERIQRAFIEGLNKVCYLHLMLRGFTFKQITSFTLRMTPPSALAELLKLDAISMKLEIAGSAKGIDLLPDIYILTEIMGFGEDEANEIMQIMDQQRQRAMQQQAASEGGGAGGAGGGGGIGGDMGGAGPAVQPGGEDVAGEQGQQGVDQGQAQPGQGDANAPGSPENASVANRKAITEEMPSRHRAAINEWLTKRKSVVRRKTRMTVFEHQFARGELKGLKINIGTAVLNEHLAESLSRIDSLITEGKEQVDTLVKEIT